MRNNKVWEGCAMNDIIIGPITIKAHPKGGWVLPGGSVTRNRKLAEGQAKSMSRLYLQSGKG